MVTIEHAVKPGTLEDAARQDWDVIVVGGGMGGGAACHALTRNGHRVLLIEKGRANPEPDPASDAGISSDRGKRLKHGHWPSRLRVEVDGAASEIYPALGCGAGGSTLLYAGTLGRLRPGDFATQRLPDGSSVAWPFRYEDLAPYYQHMERLFHVCGTPDPLSPCDGDALLPPPAMGDRDRHFFDAMRQAGLHPYRQHMAVRYLEGCTECGGSPCGRDCKQDARNVFILPALATGLLTLLEETEVVEVLADRERARGVVVAGPDGPVTISGGAVVLASGALSTPAILQRSRSPAWPAGVGNDHDLVGRYLMFHTSDFVAVWPRRGLPAAGPGRTISFRDFYELDGRKLGEVQSMGLSAGYPEILTFLHQWFEKSPLKRVGVVRPLLRIPAWLAAKVFSEASVFATIVEDFPSPENRVVIGADDPQDVEVRYAIPEELHQRVRDMRRLLTERLSRLRVMVVNHDVMLNYGHACGTCRAGVDPASSVVDADCRVHGLSNLYVLDGSFMPTSGGANPSLTIGANALRVAERIVPAAREAA